MYKVNGRCRLCFGSESDSIMKCVLHSYMWNQTVFSLAVKPVFGYMQYAASDAIKEVFLM